MKSLFITDILAKIEKRAKPGSNLTIATTNLTRWHLRAEADQTRDDLRADVQRGDVDLGGVDLIQQNGSQHADDDLILVFDLGQRVVERVEVCRRDQGGASKTRTTKLKGRPETGQIIVPNQEPGHHREQPSVDE